MNVSALERAPPQDALRGRRARPRDRRRDANELARLPFARIVAATELGSTRSGHDPEGGAP
jgi:hypothetical protein